MKRGFSLVELSIVLVILGLLVGGVLSGQALIHAAELRAVPTEFNRYFTAVGAFRDKYFAIPGDMRNATQFWGTGSAADNTCVSNSGAGTAVNGTCDGNGDGKVDMSPYPFNPGVTGENFQFWRHLQLAGLIEGNLTGLNSGANNTRFPQSKVSANTVWTVLNDPSLLYGVGNFPTAVGKNTLYLGNPQPSGLNPTLKPEDAWNIDTKMDDGKANSGAVLGQAANGGWGDCTDYGPNYRIDTSTIVCAMGFVTKF